MSHTAGFLGHLHSGAFPVHALPVMSDLHTVSCVTCYYSLGSPSHSVVLVLPSLWATWMPGPVARFSWPEGWGWDPAFICANSTCTFSYDVSQLLLKASWHSLSAVFSCPLNNGGHISVFDTGWKIIMCWPSSLNRELRRHYGNPRTKICCSNRNILFLCQ